MIKAKNPALLKVQYIRPDRKGERKECFQVLYLDDDDQVHFIEEPAEADIYIVKPEYRDYDKQKPQELTSHCKKVRVPISQIRYKIAEEAGDWGSSIIKLAADRHEFSIMNQLYKWPYVYGADFQPEFYYMRDWYSKYKLRTPKLTKAYLDIEADMADYAIDMDNVSATAYAPVSLITIILDATNDAWTFALRPYVPPKGGRTPEEYAERYKMYEKQLADHEYLMTHLEEHYANLHKEFDAVYGHINYHLREYEREIDLIADAFKLINTVKPNFCLVWNAAFDIPYLIARIQNLGYDPISVMCHPDIPYPVCSYRHDKSTFELSKQNEECNISSYTIYLCQMRNYSSIRKSQHKLRSIKLNAIADIELKDKKVEYPDQSNFTQFMYNDWRRFVVYNTKDVLLQLGIERKTNDVLTYYMRSQSNMTPYNKIFRETHLLRNVREIYFEQEGWVQGNNLNVIGSIQSDEDKLFYGDDDDDDEDEESTYKGAINADPIWNDKVGEEILGMRSSNIFRNVIDYDMGSFYPSIKIASNMDPATLLYKASLNNDEFTSGELENRSQNQVYEEKDKHNKIRKMDITGEMINCYMSGNVMTFGYDWLGLPDMETMKEEVMKILNGK